MSNWNTLHFFDFNKYQNDVVPKAPQKLSLKLMQNSPPANSQSLRELLENMEENYIVHTELKDIESLEKRNGETYEAMLSRKRSEYIVFKEKYDFILCDYAEQLSILLFTEVAQLDNYLILGRNILTQNVVAIKGSVAEECLNKMMTTRPGTISAYGGSGILNWLSAEEISLLHMDRTNVHPANSSASTYHRSFLAMVDKAATHEFGLLCASNLSSRVVAEVRRQSNPLITVTFDGNYSNIIVKY
ncbi:hypothetical protein [Neolewinella antarctica]|uniref:Uncharacterized protein n=1 Tax=Neolewinella antarctica TaxID=442734 RepID=A0ABX0XEE3_9BACT|nr:hypothetical protein [Neolewinella antarctica]NJC27684.1 hypothetical protein [Neolewinella antarctica]